MRKLEGKQDYAFVLFLLLAFLLFLLAFRDPKILKIVNIFPYWYSPSVKICSAIMKKSQGIYKFLITN